MPIRRIALPSVFALSLLAGNAAALELHDGMQQLDHNPALKTLVEATAGPVEAVFRKGGVHPTFLAGALPSSTGLAEDTAVQFLSLHGAAFGLPSVEQLQLRHVFDVGTGSVVRMYQQIDGVPVEYSGVAVRTDVTGRVLAVSMDVVALEVDTNPVLVKPEAVVKAHDALLSTNLAHTERDEAQLVILPMPSGEGRLAWKVWLGAVPFMRSNPIVYIDADTGKTLLVRNAVWFDRMARVYPENPVETPTLVELMLTNLPAGSTNLTGTRSLARNCIDQHETLSINFLGIPFDVHMCTEVQQATADVSGDFLYDPDPTAPEDDFAEAMMYYGVEYAYDHYAGLGFDLLPEIPMNATVNFRTPLDVYGAMDLSAIMAATDPYGELYTFDNAMFVESGDLFGFLDRAEDSMLFGQGSDGDFAFDGDVITHEFGHAVVAATCALGWASLDEQGLDTSTGALNEAFADTGSFTSTDDSVVGAYAGSWLTGGGIRDVDSDDVCPDNITGESHIDSLMFTGAEWDILQLLSSDAAAVKQALFTAEISLNPNSDFDEASAALVAEIRSSIGDTQGDTAQGAIDTHNIADCQRVALIEGMDTYTRSMYLPSAALLPIDADPFIPGPIQILYRPARGFQQVTVRFSMYADSTSSFFGGNMEPMVVFKRGTTPIVFDYTGDVVSGDWTDYKRPEEVTGGFWEATFWIPGEGLPAEDYYFMIGTTGDAGFIASGIGFTPSDVPYPTDDVEPVPDDSPDEAPDDVPDVADTAEPSPDADTDPDDDPSDTSGCGCSLVS